MLIAKTKDQKSKHIHDYDVKLIDFGQATKWIRGDKNLKEVLGTVD